MNWKVLFLSLILFSTIIQISFAQTKEQILNDPNISWVAEVYSDFSLVQDSIRRTEYAVTHNYHEPLKYQVPNTYDLSWYDNPYRSDFAGVRFCELMYILKDSDAIPVYRDDMLTQKIEGDERKTMGSSIDTIITFDPEAFKEITEINVSEVNPFDLKIIRLKELIYYDKKDMLFHSVPLSLGIMVDTFDYKGNYKATIPLFWMNIEAEESIPNLDIAEITWARRSFFNIDLSKAKILKQKQSLPKALQHMAKGVKSNSKKMKVYDAQSFELLPTTEIGKKVDYYEKETDLKEAKAKGKKINYSKDITHLQFVRVWTWNEETKAVGMHGIMFTPIYNVDASGTQAPIFYRRYQN